MEREDRMIDQARRIAGTLREWRRRIHADPELSGRELRTAAFVAERLRDMGYEPREGVGGTCGVVADLPVGTGPAVALRADMDALPIDEQTGLPFASKNPGVMHACGHDAHTAMLLGAAELLRKNVARLARPVRLIFQPHEEAYPGGAAPMIDGGALDGVGEVFGLHVSSQLPTGTLGTRAGPFMAGLNSLRITVVGRGGHAAMPEQCVDPIVVAAQIVLALQTVVSRSIAMTDAAVLSVTRIEGGSADNIIPEHVHLSGTIRTYDERVRARVCERVRELATGVAACAGAAADVRLDPGYPVLVNDDAAVARALDAARRAGFPSERVTAIERQGGGEDFAYFCRRVPGAFVFLGAGGTPPGGAYPHHHPRFDIDEDALPWGAAWLAEVSLSAAG